ncbi:MAG TPA: RuvX/YqgF family protein, partial [Synergistaceae bacterium]|nr:RuvX/YqgF family protein [Synergistaceae bacterium]
MGRIIALDMGSVRIGVAVSDPLGVFAQGIAVLPAEGPWMRRLEELMTSYAADRILV